MSDKMTSLARSKQLQTPASASSQAAKSSSSSSSSGVLDEDMKIVAFIHRLDEQVGGVTSALSTLVSGEDDEKTSIAATHEDAVCNTTTVPIALSRRILNRQGVEYMPGSHVDTVMSLAGDRFLASVLQQAIICRGHRLEGEALLRRERVERRKQKRERRKEKIKVAQARKNDWKARLTTAEETLKNLEKPQHISSTSSVGSASVKSKKKSKKEKSDEKSVGSSKKTLRDIVKSPAPETDELEKKIDNDELFSETDWEEWGDGSQLEDISSDEDDDSDDDEDMTLRIQDVVRSVRSYGFDLSGKIE